MLALVLGSAILAALILVALWQPLAAVLSLCAALAAAVLTRLLTFPKTVEELKASELPAELRTQTKQHVETLSKTNDVSPGALLDATMNSMREGVLIVDGEMHIVAANSAAREVFSGIEGKLESLRLSDLTRNPSIHEAFRAALDEGQRVEAKVEMRRGDRRAFDLRVAPLRLTLTGRARGAIGVFFDITQLERLERVRQEFLSNVSHELRTPLTAIIAFVETLEDGAIDDSEHNRRFLKVIRRNAVRMHNLIDDILELSSIEAGTVTVEPRMVHLAAVIEDIKLALAARAEARKVTLHNEVSNGLMVYADARRLEQMLTNLVDNAIKFNREEGRVLVRHEATEGRDRISVTDTGDGISSEHIARIFERFYRIDRARSREMGGTGLGLAIVKHLARAHGGEATVQSTPGEGSTFTIELPSKESLESQSLES
jgi:two-component system phosphate regulon sensor histidine kinase PhoR